MTTDDYTTLLSNSQPFPVWPIWLGSFTLALLGAGYYWSL